MMLWNVGNATVFTVVSPMDNTNPGTLRWALDQAANNGITTSDTIVFAIPSPAQNTHVIVLNSELPYLTSNLVIDGTSQTGLPFGIGDSKIAITPAVFQNCKRGFVIKDAINVEIYGCLFAGFINSDPTVNETFSDAIYMSNVTNVQIGNVTKGNSFTGNYWAIRHQGIPDDPRNPPPAVIGSNIVIKSNTIGKNQTGRPLTRVGVVNAITLYDCNNVVIGGQTDEENTFMVFLNAIRITLKSVNASDTSKIEITGNKFDPATSVPPLPFPLPMSGIEVNDNPISPGLHIVRISNNDIEKYTSGIVLGGLKHPFLITNNIINLDSRNNLFPASLGINIIRCDSGRIGGINASNIIHDIKNYGITETGSKNITITKNSIYCTPKGILITAPATVIPRITDLVIDAALLATGKTCPGCRVEIFNTNSCNSQIYNGETFETNAIADNTGNFTYAGPLSCNTSFTTTAPTLNTSEFYTPYDFIIDTSAIIVHDASCGRNNGSITGLRVFSGVDFSWQDNAGNIVSTDTVLLNVGPGFYRLVATKQNIGCIISTHLYEIKNIQPAIDISAILITQPSDCGGLGSIKNIHVLGGPAFIFRFRWIDQNNIIVGNSLNLLNVGAGSYRLIVNMLSDSTCSVSAGPFDLTSQPAPTIDASGIQITNSTCGKPNGSISGLVVLHPVGVQKFIWKNGSGNVAGNALSLMNVPPGMYKLFYTDDAPCDTIRLGYYNITNSGLIAIDESAKIIHASGCTISNGSVSGIIVTGATTINWISFPGNNVVGNASNLSNVASGDYILTASDNINGCIDSSSVIHVPATSAIAVTLTSTAVDETCTSANGSINVTNISPGAGYTYKWIRNNIDTIASSLSITHLSAGTYTLIAFDSNGCSQTALQKVLIDHPSPRINTSGQQIKSDTCNQSIGSISGLTITGGTQPLFNSWYTSSNQLISAQLQLYERMAGDYYLIVKDNIGCSDTTSMLHIDNIRPVISTPVYDDIYAKRNTAAVLKVKNTATGIYHIFDGPGAVSPYGQNATGIFTTPILRNDKDYYINLQVGVCYSDLSKLHITVIDNSKIYVPNAFTPNADHLNDLFKITVFGKISIDYFEIYNRWGKLVFRTKDITKGWDGKDGNKESSPGVYIWIMQGYDVDGSVLNLRGSVLLIR